MMVFFSKKFILIVRLKSRKGAVMYRFILVLLLLFNTQPSYALSTLGHQVVCQLAYEQLTISKKQKIDQLLLAISKEDAQLINHYNHNNKKAKITFAKACTWADAIKKKKKLKQYNTWHYLNVPRIALTATKNNCSDGCLTEAILIHHNEFNTTTNLQNKVQALMFLGHWLGDIHQPLHVSYQDDLGGNKRAIYLENNACKNLHRLWDDCLLTAKGAKNNKKPTLDKLVDKLAKQWPATTLTLQLESDVYHWATDALTFIRKPSFLYCQLDQQGGCQPLPQKVVNIPKNYITNYQPLLEQQLLKAAFRLHSILNTTL